MKKASLLFSGLVALSVLLSVSVAAQEPVPVEVTSPGGLKAWLVQDKQLPLIAVRFSFRGGVEQDPADKQGLANLTAALLTQGAGPYDDAAFQDRLAAQAIQLSVAAGRDGLGGEMKTLRRAKEEAFRLLGLALTQPRFDAGAFERTRDQQNTAMRMQIAKPSWQARYALFGELFGAHPYAYRSLGSTASLARITRADVQAFATQHFAKDNLVISVVGDVSAKELEQLLDQTFGALPAKAALTAVGPVQINGAGQLIHVDRPGTQTNVVCAGAAPLANDPDYYAVEVANYILGGGGFVSRLMKAVREKEGLTYGVSMGLAPMEKGSILLGQFAADKDKTAEAWALVQSVWLKFYEDGVTVQEVGAAKAYLTGSMPLSLTSRDAIANVLQDLQWRQEPVTGLAERLAKMRAVTPEDVNRVIKTWFDPNRFSAAFVGPSTEIAPDLTKPLVTD